MMTKKPNRKGGRVSWPDGSVTVENPPPPPSVPTRTTRAVQAAHDMEENSSNSQASVTEKEKKLGDPCQNCNKRPSTINWVGEGSILDWTHGFYQVWCDYCVTEYQLEYARRLAADIPELEKKLKEYNDVGA